MNHNLLKSNLSDLHESCGGIYWQGKYFHQYYNIADLCSTKSLLICTMIQSASTSYHAIVMQQCIGNFLRHVMNEDSRFGTNKSTTRDIVQIRQAVIMLEADQHYIYNQRAKHSDSKHNNCTCAHSEKFERAV